MTLANKIRQLGKVASDARWWPFYLQRSFMAPTTRTCLSSLVAANLRPPVGNTSPHSPEIESKISDLATIGLSHLGQLLTAKQAEELQTYFLQKPVHDPYSRSGTTFLPDSSKRDPESHITHHDPWDVVRAPYLFSIANRPDILAIVEGLLGCKPTLSYLATWWSYYTGNGAQQAEHFHRDVDDWRFVKLFIYLTDVGPENGPHIYVSHSSNSPKLRQIRRFSDQEVTKAFGADQIMKMTARAGAGFLEDTFGIHKGQPVVKGRRLIFQAVYSMYPLPYGPKSPVISASEILLDDGSLPDPWINRLYLDCR